MKLNSLLLMTSLSVVGGVYAKKTERPNVIFIHTDDMGVGGGTS